MKGKGLFAVAARPPVEDDIDDEELDDYAADLELDEDEPGDPAALGGGPFDDYAAIVLDVDADPAARSDALRQAILTVLEERGSLPRR